MRVSTIVVVSPSSASCTVTPTMAPVSRSTACSAVWARCVRPSFIFVIFASGSCGFVQSSFDPFFLRVRSKRASSARVGVAMPEASASRVNHASYPSPVSRRTMLRIAALASSVVASIPIVYPWTRWASARRCNTHVNTAWCVSRSIRRRVRDSVEWSGGASCSAKSRNSRMLSESAARHAIARSESRPSK